jgi:uncharacterized membrane protein YozB (DUF420 family)
MKNFCWRSSLMTYYSSLITHDSSLSLLTGPNVIFALKVAVVTVTFIFLSSLLALARGKYWLHGRINMVFFSLTLAALISLEVVARIIDPTVFDYLDEDENTRRMLMVHLCFSLPATAVMPLMLFTGLTHRRHIHLRLAALFVTLWTGTVITGVFFLPHTR